MSKCAEETWYFNDDSDSNVTVSCIRDSGHDGWHYANNSGNDIHWRIATPLPTRLAR